MDKTSKGNYHDCVRENIKKKKSSSSKGRVREVSVGIYKRAKGQVDVKIISSEMKVNATICFHFLNGTLQPVYCH